MALSVYIICIRTVKTSIANVKSKVYENSMHWAKKFVRKIFKIKNCDLTELARIYTANKLQRMKHNIMSNDFLSLTNAGAVNTGKRVALRRDLVTTVFTQEVIRTEGAEPELITCLFCPPLGTWEVKETFEQVMKQLKTTDNPERLLPQNQPQPKAQ